MLPSGAGEDSYKPRDSSLLHSTACFSTLLLGGNAVVDYVFLWVMHFPSLVLKIPDSEANIFGPQYLEWGFIGAPIAVSITQTLLSLSLVEVCLLHRWSRVLEWPRSLCILELAADDHTSNTRIGELSR